MARKKKTEELEESYLQDVPSLAEQAGAFFTDLTPEEKIVVFHFSENVAKTVELITTFGIKGYTEIKVREILGRQAVKRALDYLGFLDRDVTEEDIKRRLSRILMSPMSSETAALRASTELSKLLALYETKEQAETERYHLRNLLKIADEEDRKLFKKGARKLPTPEETLLENEE